MGLLEAVCAANSNSLESFIAPGEELQVEVDTAGLILSLRTRSSLSLSHCVLASCKSLCFSFLVRSFSKPLKDHRRSRSQSKVGKASKGSTQVTSPTDPTVDSFYDDDVDDDDDDYRDEGGKDRDREDMVVQEEEEEKEEEEEEDEEQGRYHHGWREGDELKPFGDPIKNREKKNNTKDKETARIPNTKKMEATRVAATRKTKQDSLVKTAQRTGLRELTLLEEKQKPVAGKTVLLEAKNLAKLMILANPVEETREMAKSEQKNNQEKENEKGFLDGFSENQTKKRTNPEKRLENKERTELVMKKTKKKKGRV
ncbi:hypothetical protein ACOMHN_024244 [Nucella lapillus]